MDAPERIQLTDKAHTVCLSGHRPAGLPGGGDDPALKAALTDAIIREVEAGMRVFINGCMAGFDVLAGELILSLRERYPALVCVTVAPFRQRFFDNRNWTPAWKRRALALYRASDLAFALEEVYRSGIYYARNDFMVEHASCLICYLGAQSRRGGGTRYTVDRARNLGLRTVKLAEKKPERA